MSDSTRQRARQPSPGTPALPSSGTIAQNLLLTIGDSWFSYWPPGDLLDVLVNEAGWEVKKHGRSGLSLAAMLYDPPPAFHATLPDPPGEGATITEFVKTIGALDDVRAARVGAILVSAGGNDVASPKDNPSLDDLPLYRILRQNTGDGKYFDEALVDRLVDEHLRTLFETLLTRITRLCNEALGRTVPIVLHGYAHPVPDGRGPKGRGWLMPPILARGYTDPADGVRIMESLIDRLDSMQEKLIRKPAFRHVHFVDLRGILSNDRATYAADWQNELHPTIPAGFRRAALRIDELLKQLITSSGPTARRARGASAYRAR